jgi:ankyrin repeat protein
MKNEMDFQNISSQMDSSQMDISILHTHNYYNKITSWIKHNLIEEIKHQFTLGLLDSNYLSSMFPSFPFLYFAIYYDRPKIISLLLRNGARVVNDNISCKKSFHVTSLLQLLDSTNYTYDPSLFITLLTQMIEAYSNDPREQQCYVTKTCECGISFCSLLYGYKKRFTENTYAELYYLYCKFGGNIPQQYIQDAWNSAVIMNHEQLLLHMIRHYDTLIITDFDIYSITNVKRYSKISKNGLLEILDHYHIKNIVYSNILSNNKINAEMETVLHNAVRYGDYDIICKVVENPVFSKEINTKNKNGDTPLHVAMKQGLLLHTLLLLQVTVSYKKQHTDILNISNPMKQAYHEFYSHIFREIERCVMKFNPLQENDTEPINKMVQQLILDIEHPSGIGFPDTTMSQFHDIMKLESDKEIEHTINTWAETNPLVAMRWDYVYKSRPFQNTTCEHHLDCFFCMKSDETF